MNKVEIVMKNYMDDGVWTYEEKSYVSCSTVFCLVVCLIVIPLYPVVQNSWQ